MSAPLTLVSARDDARAIAWRNGRAVSRLEFRRQVNAVRARLPATGAMINLCEDRHHFLTAFAAALASAHAALLPPSRAALVIDEVHRLHPGSYVCDDAMVAAAIESADESAATIEVASEHVAMIGFTSGSSGQPKQFPKTLHHLTGSNARGAQAIRSTLQVSNDTPGPWIVATVPPQHTYGMEFSILLPLLGGMAVHCGRPLFPADIAQALEEVPEPRVLVSTPVHLRAMVASGQVFPRTQIVICATAPLDAQLARDVEGVMHGELLEIFGSTETCAFARRRTAMEEAWQLFSGVTLTPHGEGTHVNAPWFAAPTPLQDFVDMHGDDRFVLRGRNSDLIEVAGKRASLADLTHRVFAIPGVNDAVVFQPEQTSVGTIRRVAALVVAPGLTAKDISAQLAAAVDPAFLPRPLVVVERLPRNEVGKLPMQQLLEALRESASDRDSDRDP
jgi:acyl-coenzyme A synthetase/AMP-(fatty) acid ligase